MKWLILIFLLIIVFTFLPVKCFVRFFRKSNEILITIKIYVWFIPVKFQVRNPTTRFFWVLSKNRYWQKKTPQDLQAKEISWTRFLIRYYHLQKLFRTIYHATNEIFKKVGQRIKITKLNVHTEFGLQDAAQTAITAGLIWCFLGILYSRLASLFSLEQSENNFVVQPIYQNEKFFILDTSCIFEFRLGHIIIIVYQVFKNAGQVLGMVRRLSS